MWRNVMSQKDWRDTIKNYCSLALAGRSDRAPGVRPSWISERNIRVMWESGINRSTVDLVTSTIFQRIHEFSLGYKFKIEMSHGSRGLIEHIRPTLSQSGRVDEDALFLFSDREHAHVYILRRPLVAGDVYWGASWFEYGTIILALPGERQNNHNLLKRIVGHETCHLLGMRHHCDQMGLEGIPYNPSCNMHHGVPSWNLCPGCRDFVRRWWHIISKSGKSGLIR